MKEADKLINQIVIHKTFGKGIIKSVDEKYLEVDFVEKSKVSKFAYPSCFDGFLMLENPKMQVKMQKVVEKWKVESGTVQKEELRQQYENTVKGIRARQVAAEKKKIKAAQRTMEHRLAYSNMTMHC